jgi:hypothetical protein
MYTYFCVSKAERKIISKDICSYAIFTSAADTVSSGVRNNFSNCKPCPMAEGVGCHRAEELSLKVLPINKAQNYIGKIMQGIGI